MPADVFLCHYGNPVVEMLKRPGPKIRWRRPGPPVLPDHNHNIVNSFCAMAEHLLVILASAESGEHIKMDWQRQPYS
jgi:hypothetical protein